MTNAPPEWQVLNEDCLDVLKRLPPNCLDSMITDPPAGIGFMGREWDSDKGGRVSWIAWLETILVEALRVLKPGAHALVWAIPRTSHWTATALEQAGFEIRDVVTHHFGTGFPKSLNVSKAIDDAAGATREVVGDRPWSNAKMDAGQGVSGLRQAGGRTGDYEGERVNVSITAPATEAAKQWDGWGTALKPASEHWILARKPLAGTVAANVQAHGTGALNIDECRVGYASDADLNQARVPMPTFGNAAVNYGGGEGRNGETFDPGKGRWPANLIFSHGGDCFDGGCGEGCPVAELDRQSGTLKSGAWDGNRNAPKTSGILGEYESRNEKPRESSSGGASRFFYVAKPSTAEREEGLSAFPKKKGAEITDRDEGSAGIQNARAGAGRTSSGRAHHPTVKSVTLMSYLVKLITPPKGIVLDPFTGSGGTGIAATINGFSFLGIEKDKEFSEIARGRIAHWSAKTTA